MITEEQKLEIQHAHAAFISVGGDTYRTYKEIFGHLSRGSYISNQMLNCYKSIVPNSARVLIYEGEE